MHENLRALRWVSAWNSFWVFTFGYKWWKLAFQSRCAKIAMLPLTAIDHFGIVWEEIFIFFVCKKQIANYNPGQIHARWLHRQRPLRRRPRKPAPLPLSIMTKILEKKNLASEQPRFKNCSSPRAIFSDLTDDKIDIHVLFQESRFYSSHVPFQHCSLIFTHIRSSLQNSFIFF